MVDPAIIGGAVVVAGAAIAAGYSYFSGNSSSVDVDDDGNDELTFGGNNDVMADCNDPTEDPAYRDDEFAPTGTGEAEDAEGVEPETFQAAPDAVRDIGTDLADITGIGDTRADDLKRADFETASDIYFASDEELTDVSGIGDLTVSQIRGDIGGVEDESAGNSDESDESTETDDESGGSSSTDETESNSADGTESSTDGESTDSTEDAGSENTSRDE